MVSIFRFLHVSDALGQRPELDPTLCPVSPVVVADLISSLPRPEDMPEGHHRENRSLHLLLELVG